MEGKINYTVYTKAKTPIYPSDTDKDLLGYIEIECGQDVRKAVENIMHPPSWEEDGVYSTLSDARIWFGTIRSETLNAKPDWHKIVDICNEQIQNIDKQL